MTTSIGHTDFSQESLHIISAALASPGADAAIYDALSNSLDNEENSFDLYMSGLFSLFGKDHELTYGINLTELHTYVPSYSRTYSSGTQYVDYFDLEDALKKPDINSKTSHYNEREYQYAAYINSRFDLGYNTFALLGARVTDWRKNRDTTTYSTGAFTKDKLKETGYFTPYFGITHDLTDALTAYASYTSIFSPQTRVTARGENGSMLEPKEGTTYEVGIKQSFNDDRLHATLNLYRSDMDNQPVWLYFEGGVGIYKTEDGTKSEGVELELVGELAEGWNFSGGYSYNHSEDQHGNRIGTTMPQHMVKTFTTYRFPGALSKLTLGGGINWNSSTRTTTATYSRGSYSLVNLMGRYDINQNLSLSAHIDNLFDKRYLSGYSNFYGLYGAPRNFMVNLKYTY